jgi:hypothetical protein
MATHTIQKIAGRDRHGAEGPSAIEIKVTLRPDEELRGVRALELNEDTAEVRIIYFYDTTSLNLYHSGVVLRARLVKGDQDDSKVKIRPVDPAKVHSQWIQMPGFKIEADSTGESVVCSASLSVIQKRDEIDEVAQGKRAIDKLFSIDQERLLAEFHPHSVDFKTLRALGPVRVLRWTTKHRGFPHELTTEEWRLPDGEDLLEVSIKIAPDQGASARKAFEGHLRQMGLDPAGAQETKTRTALKHLVRAPAHGPA